MNQKYRKLLLTLRFIPFILSNGMNLFPIIIFTQLFLSNRKVTHFVLPLILYYSFKTTILFLIKIKPIKSQQLLKIAIVIGIVGSILGAFYSVSFYFVLLSGSFLGMCSGLLYPSFLTVQFHEKALNNFTISKKDQIYSLVFALVFSYLLFRMIKVSITFTFLFLAISLLFLFVILTVYPEYEIVDEADYPEASIVESLFLFIIGFFSIFIIKAYKRLGTAHSLPFFFLFLLIVVIIYLALLYKTKPERRYSKSLTQKVIFKGMLTNFILVFCPFYQLIEHGGQAIYQVYGVYLAGIIVSPTIFSLLGKQVKRTQLVFWGILLGLVLLLFNSTFFIGIFVVTLFNSHLNQLLNQWVYKNGDLPQDYRLYAKYRLNNLGSIIHQIVMMLLIYLITLITRSASIGEIFMSYSNKVVDESAFFTLDITKYFLILVFTIYLFVLRKNSHNKKASKINS